MYPLRAPLTFQTALRYTPTTSPYYAPQSHLQNVPIVTISARIQNLKLKGTLWSCVSFKLLEDPYPYWGSTLKREAPPTKPELFIQIQSTTTLQKSLITNSKEHKIMPYPLHE